MSLVTSTEHSTAAENPSIGGSPQRHDSIGKVTGSTQYVEDMLLPGMLYAAVLRSPHHHARLKMLDATAASEVPGVACVITAEDIPGINGLNGYSRDEPVLTPVGDTLRQKGAPIALLIAASEQLARRAVASINIEYEQLPGYFDLRTALHPAAKPIYPAGNVLSNYKVAHGDLERAWEAADLSIDTVYETAFQEHATMEREVTLGYIDQAGRVTVIGGTHEPHWQQAYIAQVINLPVDQVRVIVPPTGGSFGSRQDPWPLVAAGLMAHRLRCPVRLAYSRQEVFDATPKRHAYQVRMRIGARSDGRVTGIETRIDANTGGYDSAGYWIPNYAVTASGGPYHWPAVDAFARSVYTNAPKCGQFRGYGTPQSVFALECTLDELAQRLDIDPFAFRRKNSLTVGVNSFLGYPVGDTFSFLEVLDALEPSYHRYLDEAVEYNAANTLTPSRMGVGLAGMWYRFGKSGSLKVETRAELASDGHFILYCSAPDYGQGISTVMHQLAAEGLGVSRDRIELVNADTASVPDSGVQGASRATFFVGGSLVRAVENLKKSLLATAAEMLDLDPAACIITEAGIAARTAHSHVVSYAEIAAEFDRIGKSRCVSGVFDLTPQFPDSNRPDYLPIFVTGAQVAQVVVDLETGHVNVRRVAASHDVGRVINPLDAVGQIQGAIVMGVGSALIEEYTPGVSNGFANYLLPMIYDMPHIDTILVESASLYGPYGAKGLGEAAILPTAPAILNALSRAIGTRLRQIPATPERVLHAIKSPR
jgi:CO/xanthine dehydrogenase Mo-binding subunit